VKHANAPLSMSGALSRLSAEMSRLKAWDVEVFSNPPLRSGKADDPGVAVYFRLSGRDQVFACDKWDRVPDNIASIAAHVEAIRAIDRYGVGTRERALEGYRAAIPASVDDVPWRDVLGVELGTVWHDVVAAYHARVHEAHPDKGGSREQMERVKQAFEAAKEVYRQ